MVSINNKILKSSDFEEYQYSKKIVNEALIEANNIKEKAEILIKNSEIEAKKIIEDAELIKNNSYKEGYDEGVRQAQSETIDQTINFVSKSLEYLKDMESDIVNIIVASVQNIIRSYEPDEALYQYIKGYVDNIVTQKKIVLRVSPIASRVLNKRIATFNLNRTVDSLLVVPDIRLDHYDIVIETEFGTESVNIEGKLTHLTNSFSLLMTGSDI